VIIAIEGLDAAGKATQAKRLAERLRGKLFSFPNYTTPAGEAILGNLKSEWAARPFTFGDHDAPEEMVEEAKTGNALVLQSLMAVNRLELGWELCQAAANGLVILDRYDASAIVYGSMDGLDEEWLRKVNEALPVRPDLYILIDIPVEESFRRRPERRDRNESNRAYLERVRNGYVDLFQRRTANPIVGNKLSFSKPKWHIVDGVGTIEEVHARVLDVVTDYLIQRENR
jgi:dTMP kinase